MKRLRAAGACIPAPRGSRTHPHTAAFPPAGLLLGLRATTICVALSLAACQSPAIKDRIVEVDKPVAVRPIQVADVPTPPPPLPPRPAQLSAAADLLLSKWCAAVSYVLKADPLLRVSAGMPQKALEQYKECEGR